ncbi:MAG: hypothetical protein GY754_43045 [bacterium]|nr:hypothetical protein [bacterium]
MQYKITFKHTIIGILLIVFTVGCASVRLRSFQDPEYRGKQFERVIVEAKFQDLAKREKFE